MGTTTMDAMRQLSAAIILTIMGCSSGSAEEWYEKEEMRCESAGTVVTNEMLNAIIPRKNPVAGRANQGLLYYVAKKSDFEATIAKGSRSRIGGEVVLDKTNAATMKKHFSELAGLDVPFFVGASAALIPEPVVKVLYKGTLTLLSAMLKANARKSKFSELAAVTAEGGVLTHVLTAEYDATKRPYISSSVVYSVKVGTEYRQYSLLSCSFAVKLQ